MISVLQPLSPSLGARKRASARGAPSVVFAPMAKHFPSGNIEMQAHSLTEDQEHRMNTSYQHLAVAELEPGMVLSDEIVDGQGQTLLTAGAVLTERSIEQLCQRGIDAVAVLCVAPPRPVDAARTQERIDHLFRKNDPDDAEDWATGILRRYVTDYRLQREIDQ